MIICPLCQCKVHIPFRDVNGALLHLNDDATDDFDCPTMIEVAPGRRWHHYSRSTIQGAWTRYSIIYPPFDILWFSIGRLVVEQFSFEPGTPNLTVAINRKIVFSKERGASFQDFLKTAERFKILVPFS